MRAEGSMDLLAAPMLPAEYIDPSAGKERPPQDDNLAASGGEFSASGLSALSVIAIVRGTVSDL